MSQHPPKSTRDSQEREGLPVHPNVRRAKQRLMAAAFDVPRHDSKPESLPPCTDKDLTDADKAKILRLSRDEQLHSQQIAQALHISQNAVKHVLRTFQSTTHAAHAYAEAKSYDVMQAVITAATNAERPSMKGAELALKAAKVLGDEPGQQQAVQVVVNMPSVAGADLSDTAPAVEVMDAEDERG